MWNQILVSNFVVLVTGKLLGEAASDPSSLVANAIATAFALAVAVYISANVSGGHVNPAVTFGMAIGSHISIMMAIFYWISQLLGSVMACLLLKVVNVGQVPNFYCMVFLTIN